MARESTALMRRNRMTDRQYGEEQCETINRLIYVRSSRGRFYRGCSLFKVVLVMRCEDSAQNVFRSYPGRRPSNRIVSTLVSVGSGLLDILVRLSEVLLPTWQDD